VSLLGGTRPLHTRAYSLSSPNLTLSTMLSRGRPVSLPDQQFIVAATVELVGWRYIVNVRPITRRMFFSFLLHLEEGYASINFVHETAQQELTRLGAWAW
jgi:hypothetical protein